MSSRPHEPILLELGEERWEEFTDDIAAWLRNVQLAQSSFRHLAEETAAELEDPRAKEMIQRIAESAKDHEQKVDELCRLIGHEPSDITKVLGEVTAQGRQLLGNVLGMTGGASGPWHDLRQMLLANLNAIGAFGAVEQLGLTLGLPELAQVAFSVVRDKSTEQLVIEEYMLELAPQAILYGKQVQRSAKPVDHPEQYPRRYRKGHSRICLSPVGRKPPFWGTRWAGTSRKPRTSSTRAATMEERAKRLQVTPPGTNPMMPTGGELIRCRGRCRASPLCESGLRPLQ